MSFEDNLLDELSKYKTAGLLRSQSVVEPGIEERLIFEHKKLISFSSNNYLGLANRLNHINTLDIKRIGSTASPLVNGYTKLLKLLEEKTAAFKKKILVWYFPPDIRQILAC